MLSQGAYSSIPAIDRLKSGKRSPKALPETALVLAAVLERLSWKKTDSCGAALRATPWIGSMGIGSMGSAVFGEMNRLVCWEGTSK